MGWNSTIWKFTIMLEFISFNSQRDEILRNAKINLQNDKLFQFPTGWNSTKIAVG